MAHTNTSENLMGHIGMTADDELQRQYYEAGKVYRLQIESTLKCSQLCDYCYAESKPGSIQGLSNSKIRELIDSAGKMKIKVIDWLGGDPLVRPDWYDLCYYAQQRGLINNIWSSGIPLENPNIAQKAIDMTVSGFISVHLDSIHPKFYSEIHGDEGKTTTTANIERILQGVKNCLKLGKAPESMVNCITFVKSLAMGDAKDTIEYFYKTFRIKTCLTNFKPVSKKSFSHDWQPSLEQIKANYSFRDSLYPGDPPVGTMDVSKYYCGSMVCVNALGWLTPCSVIRTQEFGNVNETKLEILLEKHRQRILFMDFRNPAKLPGKCKDCQNNCVCFGCRSNAFYYSGDIYAADPMCQSFKSI